MFYFLVTTLIPLFGWPQQSAILDFKGVAAGDLSTCFYSDTKVRCWGDNSYESLIDLDVFSNIRQ
ncbi:MAG: hypothetical protein KDD25_08685, partial [Bdellovibrionales bacterium]|nr:hypothetical protein [Bdellovibrionales bacterium]